MAKSCALCEKSSHLEGKRKLLRGHYNPTHKKRKYPNLQLMRVFGITAKKAGVAENTRIEICTQCMRKA